VKKIVLATGNSGKVRELNALLASLQVEVVPQSVVNVPEAAETGLSFVENAILKARNAAHHSGLPAIADDSGLNNQIYALLPKFISFLLSFYIVGNYWISYHRTFHVIKRYNRGLIYLNLLFLMFIVLLPFPNDLIGKYPANLTTVIIYALFLAATGISLCLLWVYASRRYRLVDETLHPDFIRRLTLRLLFSPLLFLISIPIALVSPLVSMITWFFGFPLAIYYERRYLFQKVHKEQ